MSRRYESFRSRILETLGGGPSEIARGGGVDEEDSDEADGSRESGVFRPFRPFAAVGRSFVVESRARRALLVKRSDWLTEIGEVSLRGLSIFERGLLSAHWANFGLAEHAFVAGLARLELQLRSLGAPIELALAARRAIHTETHHARLGFSLATAYGGIAVGPGGFSLAGAVDDLSVENIVETIIREGCIAFTEAALEAGFSGEACGDLAVRKILFEIEDDERAHAELAWRALGWLLAEYPEADEAAESTFERASFAGRLEAIAENDAFSLPPTLERLGVLSARERGLIRRYVQEEIVEPCAENVVATHRKSSRDRRMR